MANEVIIDYGEWKTPSGWNELTLGMFSKIERFYSDKEKEFDVRDVLETFTAHSRDEIDQLPIEFVEKLLEALKWVSAPPIYGEPTNEITINGEKYVVNTQEKLKVGEYVATDAILRSDQHNYAAILAILCRKEGEKYDSKFENEVLPSRIEMWEKVPMLDAMRIVSFFLANYAASEIVTQLSSQALEAVNLTRRRIETLRKSGRASRLYTMFAMRKLRKLEKSINSI